MHKTKQVSIAVSSALFIGVTVANAAVSPIGPFVGAMSETWESFPNWSAYYVSTPIMGGNAEILSAVVSIRTMSTLLASGNAKPSDGSKLAYLGQPSSTITFQTPIHEFGAYWALPTGSGPFPDPGTIYVSFKDATGATIDAIYFNYSHSNTGDGLLDWHGWRSSIGIKSIVVNNPAWENFMDGLQANVVPEPSTYFAGLSALGMLGLFGWRNRK